MVTSLISTVDLSAFFTTGDESAQRQAKDAITEACTDYGFFQIVNHVVPLDLMNQAMELSNTFFNYSGEVKHESSSGPDAPLPASYNKQPDHSPDKNEYLLMFPPESPFNIHPDNPPDFRSVVMVPDPRLDRSFHATADKFLGSLLDFNPAEWCLPPFTDTTT